MRSSNSSTRDPAVGTSSASSPDLSQNTSPKFDLSSSSSRLLALLDEPKEKRVKNSSANEPNGLPVMPFGKKSSSKFQHFTFYGKKLADVPIWSKILSSILITIIAEETMKILLV